MKNAHPPRRFRSRPVPRPVVETTRLQSPFDQFKPAVQRGIAAAGYVKPTPIQEQCIPPLLGGRDVLGSAQTGTGKTAAFILPLLERLSRDSRASSPRVPRALILAPTRELAAQIGESIRIYGRFLPLRHAVVFGGVSAFHQIKALHRGADILVATPGRLLDLLSQRAVQLNHVEIFVLDEMDRMLDMGFLPDVKRVLARLPSTRQTLFFSATMHADIERVAQTMVQDPVRVSITPDQPAVERIAQKVLFVGKRDKDALLVALLDDPQLEKTLIFTKMKHAADRLARKLAAQGIQGSVIHGNKSQSARTQALGDFKRGRVRVLVATDVAARGLDVEDISHVINYDLPVEAETYVHRIGRTARAGASGDAISFCCVEDRAYLREIERLLGRPVPVEMEHAYHCQEAFSSRRSAPPGFGGSRGNGRGSGRGKAPGTRFRGRGRNRGRG